MKHFLQRISVLIAFAMTTITFAQVTEVTNQNVTPKVDVVDLALHFYSIDLTSEQRNQLNNLPIELIFKIDTNGKPTLFKINGIDNEELIELFKEKTMELDYFNPKITNGEPESAIYFLQLTFPSNNAITASHSLYSATQFNKLRMSDFESLEQDNTGFDLVIGAVANNFIGNASKYNDIGAGMKMDYTFNDNKKFLYGLNLSMYANKNLKDYPVHTTSMQLKARPLLMMGVTFGKWFNKFSMQADLNYVVQNVTEKQHENDPNWIQFKGFSPGVAVNFPVMIGKERPTLYYGLPAIISHHVNFHGGIRYVQFSQKEAKGLMFELGISYRMRLRGIKSYVLHIAT